MNDDVRWRISVVTDGEVIATLNSRQAIRPTLALVLELVNGLPFAEAIVRRPGRKPLVWVTNDAAGRTQACELLHGGKATAIPLPPAV